MAKRLSKERECYLAAHRELNPRSTQVESSHKPLSRDMKRGERGEEVETYLSMPPVKIGRGMYVFCSYPVLA